MAKTDAPGWSARVGEFRDHLEELQRSEHTRRNYSDDLLRFAAWYRDAHDGEDPELGGVGKRDILDWKKSIEAAGGRADSRGVAARASAATVNRKVAAINSFIRWAAGLGIGPGFGPVKPNKVQRSREPRSLDPETRRAYLRAVVDAGNRQHTLIVRLGLDGGLRVSEMAALRWADVKVTERKGELKVSGKGAKARTVPMTANLRQAFIDAGHGRHKGKAAPVLMGRGSGGLTVRGIQDISERYARRTRVGKRVGIDGFSIHRLRHSCADRLLNEEGLSVPEVAEILGHSDIKVTMLYLRPREGQLSDRMAAIGDDD